LGNCTLFAGLSLTELLIIVGIVLLLFGANKVDIFRATAVMLGTFDGLHRGHQAVFDRVKQLTQERRQRRGGSWARGDFSYRIADSAMMLYHPLLTLPGQGGWRAATDARRYLAAGPDQRLIRPTLAL